MATASPGLLCEESCCPTEDLDVLPQAAVLVAQLGELLPLGRRQAVAARARVPLGLLDPLADRGLGQVEVPGHLPDGAVAALAGGHDLGLELGTEGPASPRLLLCHGLHDGHPLR